MTISSPYDGKVRVGPAYLFIPFGSSLGPNRNSITLVTGEDPNGHVPARVPRPSAGLFLGCTQGVRISFRTSFKEIRARGSLSPTKVFVQEEQFEVSASLVFNNDPNIFRFLLPPGSFSTTQIFGGGQNQIIKYPLLVVLENRCEDQSTNRQNVYMYILFKRGYFESTVFNTGRDFAPLEMTYKSCANLINTPEPDCLDLPGQRNYFICWYDIITGTNIDPFTPPGTILPDDAIISEYFPPVEPLMF